jgi:hypothetical protein
LLQRTLVAILVLLVLGFPMAARAAQPRISSTSPRVTDACTHAVPRDAETVDGAKDEFADVGPGSVLCLEAGRRANLKLVNLHGSAAAPVVVRNHRGTVTIGGANLEAGIKVMASTHLRITGAGVQSQCGALYATADQRCGIQVDGANKGIKMSTTKGTVGHIEIDHVAILRVTSAKETRGILIHPTPGHVVIGLYVHHNYVSRTRAEAIYLGTEPHGLPFTDLAKLLSVEVSYNRIENVGFDGIKIKVAVSDVFVHHNVITNAGISRTDAHQGGIKIASSVGHFFNNTVIGAVEGIRMGRPLPWPQTHYYNNLVVGTIDVGIDAPEPGARVYQNTVVDVRGVGIKVRGPESVVENNIVAGTGVPLQFGAVADVRNLVARAVALVGFANPVEGDYRLNAFSRAVDAVPVADGPLACNVEITMFPKVVHNAPWPLWDRDDLPRPSGCWLDLGAFEYASSPVSPPRGRQLLRGPAASTAG